MSKSRLMSNMRWIPVLRSQCCEAVNRRLDETKLPDELWEKVDRFLQLRLPPQLKIEGGRQSVIDKLTFGQFFQEVIACQNWHEHCSFHEETLLEHLLLAGAICARLATDRKEKPEMVLVMFLCGLLHDIAKPGTNHVNQHSQPSYWGHSVVGALMLDTMYPPDAKKLGVTPDHWQNIMVATNFHMCQWRTGLLSTLPDQSKPFISYLRFGDKMGRMCKDLEVDRKHVIETQPEYHRTMTEGEHKIGETKGCLIMVNGMSGSGKSTLSKLITRYLSSFVPEKDIVHLERDQFLLEWYLAENKNPTGLAELKTEAKGGSLYVEAYQAYQREKKVARPIINGRIKAQLSNALRLGKIVVLDSVANLFGSIYELVGNEARHAYKMAIFCRRGQPFKEKDAERLGITVEKQVSLYGNTNVMTQPYVKHVKWKTLVSDQELRGKAPPPHFQPHISLAYGWTGIMRPVLLYYLDHLIERYAMGANVWTLPSIEETEKLTLRELVQSLYDGDGMTAIEDFLKPLGYHIKTVSEDPLVIGIKYLDGMNFIWRPKWARQARGSFFGLIDGRVHCLKMLLQRGVELLGKSHLDAKIDETQDYSASTLERLDDTQQQLARTFATGGPINAYLTSKRDGSLIGVNLYPRESKEVSLMRKLAEQDPFARVLLTVADEQKLPFIPVVCTQGTLMITENMWSYFLTAFYNIQESKYPTPLEMWQSECDDFIKFIENIYYFLEEQKVAPGSTNNVMSMSFEAVCPNRTTYDGVVHTELTVSYKQAHFDFLGVTVDIGTSTERYIPHFDIDFSYNSLNRMVPMWLKITHTDQVFDLMNKLDSVVKGEMEEKEVLYKSHCPDICEIDFEGFVLLAPKLDGSYDYSKIKTTLYYYAHKVRESNIPALLALPDAVNQYYPTVSKLKTFYGTLEEKVPRMVETVHAHLDAEIKKGEYSQYYNGLSVKAQAKFAKYSPEVLKRMYINACSKQFLPKARAIIEAEYKVDPEKAPAEWLRRLVMTAQPFGKQTVTQLIESKDRVVTDLYTLLLE